MIKLLNDFRGLAATSAKFAVSALACFAIVAGTVPADAAKRRTKTSAPAPTAEGPLTLMVSLQRQRVVVYDKNGQVTSAPISSGTKSHRTPTGVFSILQKRRRHYSNLYGGAPMPNMQRITWSGVALHAGHLPGYPASHGCIRLPHSFSNSLFGLTSVGNRVIVTNAEAVPQSFAHAKLLRPLPPGDPAAVTDDKSKTEGKASGAANLLLGVSPAHASEHEGLPDGLERTRAAVEAYREREIAMLEAAIAKAETEHNDLAGELKVANEDLQETIKAENLLQPEAGRITKRLSDAEDGMAASKRKFRDFILRAATLQSPVERSEAHYEEQALEAEALGHMNEFDLARADLEALDKIRAERREAVVAATARRDTLKSRYVTAQSALLNTRERLDSAKKAFERRKLPITVLLSKHSNKMYVRQGYDPVLEADISFADPQAPVGTHVYHAVDYSADGKDLRWQAVTAARKNLNVTKARNTGKSRQTDSTPAFDPAWPAQTPGNALDRVNMPDDVRDRLAELLKPGSAIIVTDERKSYETGKYTDLIVLTN
ncbi:MAG: L,D-transpeptidase family protein [Alphaproteobacteria bacterium]|nr:L,D-transpeptidase family protein [Alphaproteobacteria bacterium]